MRETSAFKTATIFPEPAGAASSMKLPRLATKATAVLKSRAPAATKAEYSPRERPATISGSIPLSAKSR